MNEIKYTRCNNLIKMSLDDLYDGINNSYNKLKENIKNIIIAEAPLTLNTLKSRLREAFNVAKISQKALEFINEILDSLHVIKTNNLYDDVIWPESGIFDMDGFRVDSDRQIYDIPYQEMILLFIDYNLSGEELYRAILSYFGLQVLTEKAYNYLAFVESKL